MKFLCVFCVVLCLHSGASTSKENNRSDELYGQFTKNDGNLTTNGTSKDSLIPLSRSLQKEIQDYPQRQKISRGPFLRSKDISLEPKGSNENPRQNPLQTKSRNLIQDMEGDNNLQSEGLANLSYEPSRNRDKAQSAPESVTFKQINSTNNKQQNSHGSVPLLKDDILNTISPNTHKKLEYLNTDRKVINNYQNQTSMKTLSLKPEQGIKLALQGVSIENASINTSLLGNPSERQHPSGTNSTLDEDSFNSIRNEINKAKGLHKIYSLAKKLKRYMIIHPDGTVEHIDNFKIDADKYRNYIAIKATELEKYAETNENNLPMVSQLVTKENQSNVSFSNASISETPLIKQKVKEKDFSETSNNVDTAKSNDLAELSTLSPVKEDLSAPTNISETKLKQDISNTIANRTKTPQENCVGIDLSIHLGNSTTVASNLKDENKNNKNSSSGWLPAKGNQDKTDYVNITSNTQCSPISSSPNTNYSGVWFQDRDFWDELKNSTHNVLYFFFIPPSPQLKKETKITIHSNGTKVEEVTDVVVGEDGIPQALKTTKVRHALENENT